MEKRWWHKSTVYQIYPRSFCDSNGDGIGDLKGITSKLDYLKKLGVDIIWLSPVYASPNVDNGYDISDYKAIQKDFGTMADFDELLAKCHSMGMKLIMDLVVNHTSTEHEWFKESKRSKENPYRDYYIWRDPVDGHEPNNWGSCFGGSAWKYDETTGQYYLHLFAEEQADLNWENPKVRQDVYSMMRWWLDKGVDGFRMDVISLISKLPGLPSGEAGKNGYAPFDITTHGPKVHEYLREMNREVLSRYKIVTVGECAKANIEETLKYANLDGKELDMIFSFMHLKLDNDPETGSKWCIRKTDMNDLKQMMASWENRLYGHAWNTLLWDNHDQPRIVSKLGSEKEEFREKSAKMLAICLHMMWGTPYVFQGEELGMTNAHFDGPDDFRDVEAINAYRDMVGRQGIAPKEAFKIVCYKSRDNGRSPMQWNRDKNAGFSVGTPWIKVNPNFDTINAEEEISRKDSVFYCYQKLTALRKEYDCIVYGDFQLLSNTDPDIFAYIRSYGDQKILCVSNFSEDEKTFKVPEEFIGNQEFLITNTDSEPALGEDITLKSYDSFAAAIGVLTCTHD